MPRKRDAILQEKPAFSGRGLGNKYRICSWPLRAHLHRNDLVHCWNLRFWIMIHPIPTPHLKFTARSRAQLEVDVIPWVFARGSYSDRSNSLAEIGVGRCAILGIATSSRTYSCLSMLSTAYSLFATATYLLALENHLLEATGSPWTCGETATWPYLYNTTNARIHVSSQDPESSPRKYLSEGRRNYYQFAFLNWPITFYAQEDMVICPYYYQLPRPDIPQDGDCSRRGDFCEESGGLLLICGPELVQTFHRKTLQTARTYINDARIEVSLKGGERNRRKDFCKVGRTSLFWSAFLKLSTNSTHKGYTATCGRPDVPTLTSTYRHKIRERSSILQFLIGGTITICCLRVVCRFCNRIHNNLQLIFLMLPTLASTYRRECRMNGLIAFQSKQWKPIGVLTPFRWATSACTYIPTKNSFDYPLIRIQIQSLRTTNKDFSAEFLPYLSLPTHGSWAIPLQFLSSTIRGRLYISRITFAVSNSSARSTKENISSSCPRLEDRITSPVKMIQKPGSYQTIFLLWREKEWIKKLPPIFFKSETRIAPNESPWYHPPGRQDIYWSKFVVIWVGTWYAYGDMYEKPSGNYNWMRGMDMRKIYQRPILRDVCTSCTAIAHENMGQSQAHDIKRIDWPIQTRIKADRRRLPMLVEFRYITLPSYPFCPACGVPFWPSCPSDGSYTSNSPAAWRKWTYILVSRDQFCARHPLIRPGDQHNLSLVNHNPCFNMWKVELVKKGWESQPSHMRVSWKSSYFSLTASQNPNLKSRASDGFFAYVWFHLLQTKASKLLSNEVFQLTLMWSDVSAPINLLPSVNGLAKKSWILPLHRFYDFGSNL